jgi:hypothetical protein
VPEKWKSNDALPSLTKLLGARVAAIPISSPIVLIRPLARAFVNIEPEGPTVTVPPVNLKHVAPGQKLEGSFTIVAVTMPMVFKLPTNETLTECPVANMPLNVPLTKVPLGKSNSLANAAVGKTRVKSANSITRLIFTPFARRLLAHFNAHLREWSYFAGRNESSSPFSLCHFSLSPQNSRTAEYSYVKSNNC